MKKWIIRLLLVFTILTLAFSAIAVPAVAATDEEIEDAIDAGLTWLAAQQNATTGSWGGSNLVAHTALAVLKFEHHAVFGLGISPFDPDYIYHTNVEKGLDYLFSRAFSEGGAPLTSPWGDPDPDDDGGIIMYYNSGERMYEHGAAMMAIGASNAPDRVVNVAGSLVNGWTYRDVLQDMVDLTAWAQYDPVSVAEGGWRYAPNSGADNSVSGYPTIGLGYAQAPAPWGFGLTIPAFVKTELSKWIDYVQNDASGGSGYDGPNSYVNTYKTGNLLYEMALVGDTPATPRVQNAVDYLFDNWNAAYSSGSFTAPGWKNGTTYSHYHAVFTMMKGLEALGISSLVGNDGEVGSIDWFDEISDAIVAEQNPAGYWPVGSYGGDTILETCWAMLAMERAVPPPNLILTPPIATNFTGTSHTLTATLVDNAGAPIPGETVTFTVTAGPHAGTNGAAVTNASGQAIWSYTGTSVGQDTIVASGGGVTSNQAKKNWEEGGGTVPSVPGMTFWGTLVTMIILGVLIPATLKRHNIRILD